ncbi:uncharacterized protein DUF4150 [Pseudoduganella lurida]|uniref:Uncharacterized protein DUF4150 n=1 Tax=Pseudoduganella lurida TaxID=1036180 RepID=A0A562REP9_9BURK|nr:DUF4150 domain-containing protein [Pseudoduganella lurida]TWI67531.1 uncharacterized protein DUF4150 [Pseudoduganella lurida]
MTDEPNDGNFDAAQSDIGTRSDSLSSKELMRHIAEHVAATENRLGKACPPAQALSSPINRLGARRDATFKAICTAPSINWTPAGSGQVPVPYQTVQDLSNSTSTARTVNFNGAPAYLLDQTKQPKGTGDERGTGKGIRSGTVTGEVKPVDGCKSVRIEGKQVVREGDHCTMNGGNNPGVIVKNAVTSASGVPINLTISQPFCEPRDQGKSDALAVALDEVKKPSFYTVWNKPLPKEPLPTQFFVPITSDAINDRHLRTANSIVMALLGPFATPGAIARLRGFDEQIVSVSNALGAALMSTLGAVAVSRVQSEPNTNTSGMINRQRSSANGVKVQGTRPPQANAFGIEQGNFSAIKPGPLPDDMAATFSGGRYSEFILSRDIVLYRSGTISQPLGQYFSLEKPGGVLQTRIDKAVLPSWPGGGKSPLDTTFGILIPAGTKVYVGVVGVQSGFYMGGTQQVVVPRPWTIQGVKVISQEPLK